MSRPLPNHLAGNRRLVPVFAAVVLLLISTSALATEAGAVSTAQTTETCLGDAVPYGWVVVDARWNPTKCGPTEGTEDNVWVLERHLDKPEGATMEVCMSQPTPRGWVVENTRWSATQCESTSAMNHNVKVIRRLEAEGAPPPRRPTPDRPARSITGIYSDMGRVPETGDVIGAEVFILHAADGLEGGYWAVVQFAEGVPEPPQLVPVTVRGTAIEFTATFAGYDMDFLGRVTGDGLEGEFDGPMGRVRLPRSDSFWQ